MGGMSLATQCDFAVPETEDCKVRNVADLLFTLGMIAYRYMSMWLVVVDRNSEMKTVQTTAATLVFIAPLFRSSLACAHELLPS